jgi:acyl-CoA thioesterase-1
MLVGLALIVCGSPALSFWWYVIAGVCLSPIAFLWFSPRSSIDPKIGDDVESMTQEVPTQRSSTRCRGDRWLGNVPLLIAVLLVAVEMPYQLWWPLKQPATRLLVIGDSVTAGLNDGERTWPRMLSEKSNCEILDASQPGATLVSARKQNACFKNATGIVILEIGGNNLLEGLSVDQFARNLEQLLADVSRPDRTIVMFELPLPPLCSRYGVVQRHLAKQYHVRLIPRRIFIDVLTTGGATVDGIHLSAMGQSLMADRIAWLLDLVSTKGTTGSHQHLGP